MLRVFVWGNLGKSPRNSRQWPVGNAPLQLNMAASIFFASPKGNCSRASSGRFWWAARAPRTIQEDCQWGMNDFILFLLNKHHIQGLKVNRQLKRKWAGWRAHNATHRPPEHPHKPRTATYVHAPLCLNGAYFSSNLAKVNRQLIKGASSASESGQGGVLVTPHIDHRNTRTSHARPRMYTHPSA